MNNAWKHGKIMVCVSQMWPEFTSHSCIDLSGV